MWVEHLPGYAPDLNPIEQVWGSLKSKELANLCSDTLHEVAGVAMPVWTASAATPHSASPCSATLACVHHV